MRTWGDLLIVFGLAVAATGAWTAVTRRRPLRPLRPELARAWGTATAITGLGVAVWAGNMLFFGSVIVELVGVSLILSGAIWVSAATPRARRSK